MIKTFFQKRGWLLEKPAHLVEGVSYAVITDVCTRHRGNPTVYGEIYNHKIKQWRLVDPTKIDGLGYREWLHADKNPENFLFLTYFDALQAVKSRVARENIPGIVIHPDFCEPFKNLEIFVCFWGFIEEIPAGWKFIFDNLY